MTVASKLRKPNIYPEYFLPKLNIMGQLPVAINHKFQYIFRNQNNKA
uniref:Uncharacterized protein n=1 Tax=Rhizophora mucronata TaxID=61149 RepID=A0A2P2QCL6_RHIMU